MIFNKKNKKALFHYNSDSIVALSIGNFSLEFKEHNKELGIMETSY